ncbi:MAG TPA: hypothetical protein VL020_05295, partial [Pseudomonadales bacterium]|nr:hypothetical protein [Pseudomonadales bacterium]
ALERFLAYAAVTLIVASVGSFFATLIAALLGVSRQTLAVGFWPVLTWVGYVGLPVGFGLVLALVLVTRNRRLRSLGDEKNR